MENRAILRQSAISKRVVAVLAAMLAAFLLGSVGGYLFKAVSLPAAPSGPHTLVGQAAGAESGSAWNYGNRRSGTQSIEGPAAAASQPGAAYREPGSRSTGPQI